MIDGSAGRSLILQAFLDLLGEEPDPKQPTWWLGQLTALPEPDLESRYIVTAGADSAVRKIVAVAGESD